MYSTNYSTKDRRFQHKIVLLTTSFQDPAKRILFSRARLYLDRIELTGWHFGEKYHQRILLDQISEITWHLDAEKAPNVVLMLEDGSEVSLVLRRADLWKRMLEERFRWSAPGRYHFTPMRSGLNLPLNDLVSYSTGMG